MKINKRVLMVLVILVGLINIVLFALPIKKNIMMFVADLFIIVFAGMLLFSYSLAFGKGRDGNVARSRYFGWPIVRVGVTGFAFSLVMNGCLIIASMFLGNSVWVVIILNCILLGTCGIALIGTDSSRNFVETQRIQREARTGEWKSLCSFSRQLSQMCPDPKLQTRIKNMADVFRYSDPNSDANVMDIESEIREELNLLETMMSEDTEKSYAEINKIERMVKKRNSMVLAGKKN